MGSLESMSASTLRPTYPALLKLSLGQILRTASALSCSSRLSAFPNFKELHHSFWIVLPKLALGPVKLMSIVWPIWWTNVKSPSGPLVALRDILRRRVSLVALGVKRKLSGGPDRSVGRE